jgi:hypothetical protein
MTNVINLIIREVEIYNEIYINVITNMDPR